MRFRRAKSNVTDLEAFRRGAAANGAYDARSEAEFFDDFERLMGARPIKTVSKDVLAPLDHSPASSAVGEHSPELSAIPHRVESSGPSIAEVCEQLDILREDNAALQRDNALLRSKLNQTLAQLRIARRQRDEARK